MKGIILRTTSDWEVNRVKSLYDLPVCVIGPTTVPSADFSRVVKTDLMGSLTAAFSASPFTEALILEDGVSAKLDYVFTDDLCFLDRLVDPVLDSKGIRTIGSSALAFKRTNRARAFFICLERAAISMGFYSSQLGWNVGPDAALSIVAHQFYGCGMTLIPGMDSLFSYKYLIDGVPGIGRGYW